MDGHRIFLALDISDAARAVCNAHVELLRRNFPYVRVGWERPEKMHITLKFLGAMDDTKLGKLESSLKEAVSTVARFNLSLSDPGVFPPRGRPRVLWIGVRDPNNVLPSLVSSIEGVCQSLGYPAEPRPFRSHITIGRVREPHLTRELARSHLDARIEPVEFEVSNVTIYESKLQSTGSVYSPISRAVLKG